MGETSKGLESVLSAEDLEQLKLAGLIDKIESGDFMPDYLTWLGREKPELYLGWKHIQYIGGFLQDVIDGKIKRLMIHVHPRIGKTTLVSEALPVYMIDKNPRHKTIIASYGQTLANKVSVKCRSFAERMGIVLNPQKRARDEWEVLDYGGGVRSCGVGGSVTGYGAHLVIIDDPVKSRKEANSATYREATYDWYTNDLYTRLEDSQSSIIYIGTKWHEDDLGGMILATEGEYSEENPNGWVVIRLPALAEENDPLGRNVGEALCPDRFNREQLLQIKSVLGNDFEALYQCRPVSLEGGMVKRNQFKYIEHIDYDDRDSLDYYRFWDRAASVDVSSDYTASILMAYSRKSKNIYILDALRFKMTTYERDQRMLQIARQDYIKYGQVRILFEVEPGSSGKDSITHTTKLFSGYNIRGIRVTTNKILRFEPFAAQVEAGNVYLLKADWNRELTSELCSFPQGKHDHYVDCCSGAFNETVAGVGFIKIGKGF